MSISELATLVGGQLASGADASQAIVGAASLAEAGAGEVTFFGNPKYLPLLRVSQAAASLVPLDFAESVGPVLIRCENPTLAFSRIIEHFAPAPIAFAPGVHPTAVIGRDVRLGADVCIGAYAVIEDGAQIGDRTVIAAHGYVGHETRVGVDAFFHPRVTLLARCIVGDRVILHSGAVLGSDGFGYELQGGKHVKISQVGIVQVDDDVEIGANTSIDRARFGKTWIQRGTKIDNLVQIGHNVLIGQHVILCGQVGIAGSTKIGNNSVIGGQVGTAGHIEIGEGTTIGAQSGVSKNLAGKQTYMGTPAMPAREWKEQLAHNHGIPKLKKRVALLEQLLDKDGKTLPDESERL